MKVLADTSVWVAHFRSASPALAGLLAADRLVIHPLVIGELACGTPPDRVRTLADLGSLQQVRLATIAETVGLIERERLYGRGCGLVDLLLLASTMLTPGAALWTLYRRLAELAEPLAALHRPAMH